MLKNSNPYFSEIGCRQSYQPIDMSRVAALILGGGRGTRLHPLTQSRCKPAICFGGRYRLIDVPISNSINSGCHKIFVITQFLSSSLHQHIFQTYRYDLFSSGFLELLPAEEKPGQKEWFLGTADAIRQNVEYFIETPVEYFLILSGDQLYNLDFRLMMAFAHKTEADLVIATLPIIPSDAKRMGVMKVDNRNFITHFHEKPQLDEDLAKMESYPGTEKPFLGSMGIYLFKREVLLKLLAKDPREDFGKHLIPTIVSQGNVAAFIHNNYWEDIGTIESFYQANMALTQAEPPFDCYNEKWPIYSFRNHLPGPKVFKSTIKNSIINEGCLIESSEITHTILGPRTVIKKGCQIQDSYVMGHKFYNPPIKTGMCPETLIIDENCVIRKAILDTQVHLGKGVQLINKNNLRDYNGDDIYIRDGIIVVPKGVSLPDGFVL